MPPDGQKPQVADNAPRPVLDSKKQERLNRVQGIVDQFTNLPSIRGLDNWFELLNRDETHALNIWNNYISQNRDLIADMTPEDLHYLYTALGFRKAIRDMKVPLKQSPATATTATTAPAPAPMLPKQQQKKREERQKQRKQQQQQQQEEARAWFANVFQKFYGAGVGEPNGYQYSIAQDPQTGARQIRIFQDPNDPARSFVFVQQPNGVWELRRGTGQPIVGNVHYDPKQRRFFALGVSEDDVLKTLQQSDTGEQQQPQQSRDKDLPAGVTTSFPLADGSIFTVSVDGMARVLRPLGNNQWAVVMERPLQELLNPQQPSATPAQLTTGAQPSEQIPSWMLLLMTLFLLMGRR